MQSTQEEVSRFRLAHDERILILETSYAQCKPAALALLYQIDHGCIEEKTQILDVRGIRLWFFQKKFKETILLAGYQGLNVLSEKFPIQAENGIICFNDDDSRKAFAIGRKIPY